MLAILRTAVLAILALSMALPASAQRAQRDWVLLGQQEVGFMVDRDIVNVDREGVRFSQLRIEAERNDVYMVSVRLVYQNGYAEDFRVDRELKAGIEALPIDLRGERSYLRKIEMVYRARPDFRGRAVVRIYGELRRRAAAQASPKSSASRSSIPNRSAGATVNLLRLISAETKAAFRNCASRLTTAAFGSARYA